MVSEGYELIENAKQNYFMKIGRTPSNAGAGEETYWSLINRVLNKANILIIPPLLENDAFVLDFKAKAQIFNDYFICQCTTIDMGSHVHSSTESNICKLNNIDISHEKIIRIIQSLNPDKSAWL